MAREFADKLRELDSKNSQQELSIEKFLTKREEAFFDKAREEKRSSAASLRSQRDSFYHPNASRTSFYSTRPDCKCSPADGLPLLMFWPQLRRLMRWGCSEVEKDLKVPRLSSRLGYRCSCLGKLLASSFILSSCHSDRFVVSWSWVLGLS